MKLSIPQQEAIRLMANGWELGLDIGILGKYWLQQGGCGRGGTSKDVRTNTIHGLYTRGLIKVKDRHFPLERLELTEAGWEFAKELK